MNCVFINCDITGYILGTVNQLNESNYPVGACNWDKNDYWVQQVIIHNITSSQLTHVRSKTSAEAMYSALLVMHENRAHQTVNHIQCPLYETKASTTNDLLKHLNTLKSYCDHINKFPNADFHVSDTRFKSIISASLPAIWQSFIEPYNRNANDPDDLDPKHHMPSNTFIGLLREKEFKLWANRVSNGDGNNTNGSNNLVKNQKASSTSTSLEQIEYPSLLQAL
jgi:gag-polypeptide of LTR copia-type